jgi:hypothetical protein
MAIDMKTPHGIPARISPASSVWILFAVKKMAVTPTSQTSDTKMTLRYPNLSVANPLTVCQLDPQVTY